MKIKVNPLRVFMLMIACVLLITGCGTVNQQIINDARLSAEKVKETSTFETVVQELDTPQKVYDWMQVNISYRADRTPEDEFRDPRTTFACGYGDCDDFAMFAQYVLVQHGYTSEIISVYTEDQGHCVCVWEDQNKKLNYMSNTGVQNIQASDLMTVADNVYAEWKVYSVYPSNDGMLRPAGR